MLAFSVLSISAATKLTATPSTNMKTNEQYVITNVTDGNYNTKFWSGAPQSAGQYILLTLDNTYNLGTIAVYFATGDKPASSKIQYSTDNSQWNDVPGGTVNSSGSSFSCDAAGVEARYVRLYLTGGSGNWLQIAEFEVYEADPDATSRTITVSVNDESMGIAYIGTEGTVSSTAEGPITVTAEPKPGHVFVNWTVDGQEVSRNAAYIDNTDGNKNYVANFFFDPYADFCKPAATSGGNKRAQSKGEILEATGVIEGSSLVFNPSGSHAEQAWSNSTDMIKVEPGAAFELKVTYGTEGWGDLTVYQMNSSDDFTLIYGTYDGAWAADASTTTLFTNINASDDLASADATAGTITFPITVPQDAVDGSAIIVRFIIHNTTLNGNPCATGIGELNYCDYVLYVEEPAPVPTEDKEVTVSESETGDAAYLTVTVKAGDATAAAPVWSIGANTVTAQALDIEVAADGATPEISISDGGSITADQISIKRTVKADEWAFMSLPFAITVDNGSIQVGGAAAVINDNIKFLVYDGALRASSSLELFSGSGWTAKESGTIDANTGFAVAINSNNGAEQVVTFSATSFSMDASDKVVSLESYEPAGVNGGIDDNWNFKGNPMLQSASKGDNYSLYIYNPSDDTYSEYAAAETAIFSPFAAWFVQSTNLNNGITFSHNGTTVAADAETNIDGRFAISINGGEDEARITVLNGSSESYVINEDAMYFAPNSNKVAQVYMIDADGAKIASSVVPAPYDEVKLAYNAAVAGAQTLTVTSVIPGTAVYLVDNEEGTETLMNEGSEYSFTSAAGLNSERFAVKTIIDVTGIEESTAETSSVSAVVTGDAVKIYGATAGETIDVYTVNGVMVSSAVAVEGENEISVPAQGVLIVKVGDEVVKIVK